ncbi:uncharacterized protein LOC126071305 [Elephas maximus indicus]|uniref:uncharacterized protein LOC126071305 n=1 Tax=Elephas maximus indicus TaxID=99487 RepID=UPI00211657AF|nr:uncharacterized protein LOC126071305 [Elephas maximus indicus]
MATLFLQLLQRAPVTHQHVPSKRPRSVTAISVPSERPYTAPAPIPTLRATESGKLLAKCYPLQSPSPTLFGYADQCNANLPPLPRYAGEREAESPGFPPGPRGAAELSAVWALEHLFGWGLVLRGLGFLPCLPRSGNPTANWRYVGAETECASTRPEVAGKDGGQEPFSPDSQSDSSKPVLFKLVPHLWIQPTMDQKYSRKKQTKKVPQSKT